MSKRFKDKSDRKENPSFFPTPLKPVFYLLPFLDEGTRFVEPCIGDGSLVRHLTAAGHVCTYGCDYDVRMNPKPSYVFEHKAEMLGKPAFVGSDVVITNPPHLKDDLIPILRASAKWPLKGFWLLPLDQLCNLWFAEFAHRVRRVIPVGRVTWIEGTNNQSTENFVWVEMYSEPADFDFLVKRPVYVGSAAAH